MAIERKEDTAVRLRKRKYEELHKEERRKATKHFDTLIKSEQMDEINAFLEKHRITKVDLVMEGYESLKARYEVKKDQKEQ